MSRKTKYTAEQKVKACQEYIGGSKSATLIARELNMTKNGKDLIRRWSKEYRLNGIASFIPSNENSHYTKEFKLMVVQEYFDHKGSLESLKIKYKIKSNATIHRWICKYNRHEELEDYLPKPEVYKMNGRKTTLEERIEIVNWCKEHNNNYKEAATIFNCSYNQVYSWVKKYKLDGEDGLTDRRGHHKSGEDLTDGEKLKRENNRLTRQNEELQRQIILLKKLNAFEWEE